MDKGSSGRVSIAEPKDAQSLNATLTRIDGLRCITVLEKSIERLQLLSLLNYDAFPNSNDQYLEIKGMQDNPTGVGNILDEQKRLEQRYEELLIATTKQKNNVMDPDLDPACYSNVDNVVERQQREELASVSAQLKEFSKQLTRQLKENPNDSDNWKKVLNERNELTNMLSACVREITNSANAAAQSTNTGNTTIMVAGGQGMMHFDTSSQKSGESLRSMRSNSQFGGAGRAEVSYEIFAKKVIDEQNEKIWADEIVKREQLTNLNVKHLQNEVTQERLMKEKEIEERQITLSELKTKVRRLKQETKDQSEKKRAETEAQAEARAREAADVKRKYQERLEYLEKKLEIENEVFENSGKHLNKKTGQLQRKTEDWTFRQVEENKELDDNITSESRKRDDQKEKLKTCEERHVIESDSKRQREETERSQEQARKRYEDVRASEYAAATKLQAGFKGYLVRLLAEQKKKKGKKGKKKA
eukprot:NODE_1810_length_1597_cov_30.143148_g1724_i0.p1 GENE.NODE_1810_length_1597_cov_30.143148_g1724_i0~~NODE_1810_length_1597_cov_30.143148_g1724_i0.p1  ORF type:complete len:475 (+),score=154.58 NODE_1810_length_1597_cov_30.143148_g1724_i0:85-1509(+)